MTLYASVLSLRRADIQALRITDSYSVHRVVYGLFEDIRTQEEKENHAPKGLLYLDQGGDAMARNILLLSNREPAVAALTKEGRAAGIVRSKEIAPDFLKHDRYQFNVIVNPTRRNSQSKKLVPICLYKEIELWFSNRSLNDWGFEATTLVIEKNDVLQFPNKEKQIITLSQAHVRGQLKVTDRAKFQHSFANGLGRGSAFGCGLLRLIPITTNPFDFN